MWHRGQVVFLVVVLIVGQIVIAQTCEAFLNHGLYNIEVQTSEEDFEQSLFSDVCSASFNLNSLSESKAKSVGASLSYAGFGFGASSSSGRSKEQIEISRQEFCSTMSSETKSGREIRNEVKTLLPQALEAFERCVARETKGLRMDVQMLPNPKWQQVLPME
jgi:regulatory protein YycI of two-component signal transduction system YycFG